MIRISSNRFLLITAIGAGFWQEMHHVLGQLLKAELTDRIPIVFWGRNSMYGIAEEENAFDRFFLPVSDYAVHDLTDQGSAADVLVSDSYIGIEEAAQQLTEGHPLCDLDQCGLYSRMLQKYIRLQPEIQREIDAFYQANMEGSPIIAVHIRGSDKISEVANLHELNDRYPAVIDAFLMSYPSARIFLMTDCRDILSEYRRAYGVRLISTDCKRVLKHDLGVHFQSYEDEKRKGVEIVKDTWLASKSDYFIGNKYSNVSRAVSELKYWPDSCIRLLY